MISKIKQGNSVPVKFTVMENGEQKDMSGATDLSWKIQHAEYGCRRVPELTVVGGSNPYTVVVNTTATSPLGVYFLSLSYVVAGEARSVDALAFELVAHTSTCGCQDPNKAICLVADTCIGAQGPAGTIEEVTASVDDTAGVPNVKVDLDGTPEKRTIALKFSGLKGETPKITADEKGNIYSDGELVTGVVAEAVTKAEDAAENADKQASRAQEQAIHPPKIVDVDGLKYWAFWDEATKDYIVSGNRAEGGAIIPLFWVDPETLKLYVTYQNGYEGAKFKLENGKLYSIKTIEQ